jgi:hypothetical protein
MNIMIFLISQEKSFNLIQELENSALMGIINIIGKPGKVK